jgi:hypothetical protein
MTSRSQRSSRSLMNRLSLSSMYLHLSPRLGSPVTVRRQPATSQKVSIRVTWISKSSACTLSILHPCFKARWPGSMPGKPAFTLVQAAELAAEYFGVPSAAAKLLPSYDDQNFKVSACPAPPVELLAQRPRGSSHTSGWHLTPGCCRGRSSPAMRRMCLRSPQPMPSAGATVTPMPPAVCSKWRTERCS